MADTSVGGQALADNIAADLPYLRRYARALTGSQSSGDAYALASLEAILAEPEIYDDRLSPRVALFKVFSTIWSSSGARVEPGPDEMGPREKQAQKRLASLTSNTREALLMHSVEMLGYDDIGEIMGMSADEAENLVAIARREMASGLAGKVMIIEDEPIIAMDLQSIVEGMGHQVTGVARTRDEAGALAATDSPDLVLADIQLADRSSGIDAVNDILHDLGSRPVVFITAFPERLLTGERPEPAFLISKPYSETQVQSAVSQAMFFATTEEMQLGA